MTPPPAAAIPTAPTTGNRAGVPEPKSPATTKVTLTDEKLKQVRTAWGTVYPWTQDGDEWSKPFGGTRGLWEVAIRPRIAPFIPARRVLEIAPGHGRVTQHLLEVCDELTIVDITPECIEACKKRFGNRPGLTYVVNDGRTLPTVADSSIDFAFSWDSLVHVDRWTIASYIQEFARVLAPGGVAWIHHSNVQGVYPTPADIPQGANIHVRSMGMSAKAFREDCQANGLWCVAQELIPFGAVVGMIDAISVVRRPLPGEKTAPTVIKENEWWASECHVAQTLTEVYYKPTTKTP